jgi:hypothetical protein
MTLRDAGEQMLLGAVMMLPATALACFPFMLDRSGNRRHERGGADVLRLRNHRGSYGLADVGLKARTVCAAGFTGR